MKIVLTGHKGFIGNHYFNKINNDHIVTTFDRRSGQDLKDSSVTKNAPDCDIVVHMAATNGTRLFYEIPTEVAFNNTIPTFNLIDRYKGSSTKFVFTSTCEIFNGAIDKGLHPVPTDETVPVMFEDITNPRWSYSIPKALGENLVANSGLEWLIIRYFNIYGPGQVDHFISEFVERVVAGEYYIKGNDTRSFCFIDDAVEITHRLVMNNKNCIVNVGRQEESEIAEVARIILDVMGIDPKKLEILPGAKGSAKRRCPDTSRMKELTGFTEYTSLRDGLKKTVESLL
jgi:UDP-glucose 4-epimerase/UDP-glucuronate decarboxylase